MHEGMPGMTMIRLIGKLRRDEHGGTAIEYGLIATVIVIAMLGALLGLAHATIDIWGNVTTKVTTASDN